MLLCCAGQKKENYNSPKLNIPEKHYNVFLEHLT